MDYGIQPLVHQLDGQSLKMSAIPGGLLCPLGWVQAPALSCHNF